jgi:uncharacterized membrane protein
MNAAHQPWYGQAAPGRPVPRTGPDAAAVLLVAATIATGLIAGTYYAFACAVLPGIRHAGDRSFVDTMQRINASIQNPVFFASLFGAPVLTGAAAFVARRNGSRDAMRWAMAALVLCAIGLVSTVGINVPLNDELAAAGDPRHIAGIAAVRARFETPWVAWNIVRTLVSTAALGCLGRALLLHGHGYRALVTPTLPPS